MTLRVECSIIKTDSNITDNFIKRSLIYNRKNAGPRIEPWGSPTLTRHSCKNFPSRSNRIHLLLRKDKIKPYTKIDLTLKSRPACQTLIKVLDVSSYTSLVAPDLLSSNTRHLHIIINPFVPCALYSLGMNRLTCKV